MKSCENCIFWPVCEDWSKDYYLCFGGSNPFPLKGDIINECELYKSVNLYEIKKKSIKPPRLEYFGPVIAVVEYYEDDMLDQIYHYFGRKTESGYVWKNDVILTPDENHEITIYKANEEEEIISYFPIERLWR